MELNEALYWADIGKTEQKTGKEKTEKIEQGEDTEEQEKEEKSRNTWPGETASSRDFIAGEESGIDAYLPNISLQFINV